MACGAEQTATEPPPAAPTEPAASRPPILLISLDTLRADALGSYGYGRGTSPNIDRLAAEAIVFERAYSQSPKTAESHMTLMTGLHPRTHGVINWLEDEGRPPRRLGDSVPTLAQILREAGYRTHGLHGGGQVAAHFGFDRGFDRYEPGGWGASDIFGAARTLLREELLGGQTPWFLFLHTYEIHDPYLPPEDHARRFVSPDYRGEVIGSRERLRALAGTDWWEQHRIYWDRVDPERPEDVRRVRDLYDAGIHHTDQELGELLSWLRQQPAWERLLVVVLSDHGEEFREHGGFLHNSLHREVLQVPLIVRLPGGAPARPRRLSEPVRLIDVMPTLLEHLGLPLPEPIEGRSLLPLLEGRPSPEPVPVRSAWHRAGHRALLDGGWKLIHRGRERDLYWVALDEGERLDLAGLLPSRAEALGEKLARRVARSAMLAQQFEPGAPVVMDERAARRLRALGYAE